MRKIIKKYFTKKEELEIPKANEWMESEEKVLALKTKNKELRRQLVDRVITTSLNIAMKDTVSSEYSLDYLIDALKLLKLCGNKNIKITLKEDYPIRVEGTEENTSIIIAPRLNDENGDANE